MNLNILHYLWWALPFTRKINSKTPDRNQLVQQRLTTMQISNGKGTLPRCYTGDARVTQSVQNQSRKELVRRPSAEHLTWAQVIKILPSQGCHTCLMLLQCQKVHREALLRFLSVTIYVSSVCTELWLPTFSTQLLWRYPQVVVRNLILLISCKFGIPPQLLLLFPPISWALPRHHNVILPRKVKWY